MKKKKIIVTGCEGFIGSALTRHLCKNYHIIGIDRRKSSGPFKDNTEFYHQDINDSLPDIENVYAVIHLAASPGVRDSHEKFEAVCRDNILGTQRIIDKCITSWHPKKLILTSSSSIYGNLGADGHALKEEEFPSPQSPYAYSKVADEMLMRTYKNCGMLDGIDACAIRLFTVTGEGQREELAIRAFTDRILRDEPIILNGSGKQSRDFIYIGDVCRAIQALLEIDFKHDIYNIGSGESHSINEIIHMIATYLDKDVTIKYQPRNCFDVDKTLADISRILIDTGKLKMDNNTGYMYPPGGWKPKISFEEGLKREIEWCKNK